jgi:UDP-N-acetylmuramoyl-tripeptide--D-alanyl-D-alanine ligase
MQYLKAIAKKVVVYLLTVEARILLARFKPKIVAVTGSVGKTSTKDALFSVLSGTYKARKSDKSFNSEIGVPLTVLGLKNPWNNPLEWVKALYEGMVHALFLKEYPEWLVLEVGADHPGDIGRVVRWIHPDVAVLTAVPDVPVHVEFFPSTEAVLKEKCKLINAVKKDGAVIIDGDCVQTAAIAAKQKGTCRTFGFTDGVSVRVVDAAIVYDDNNMPEGMEYTIATKTAEYHTDIDSMLGAHLALPIAAAVALAEHVHIDVKLVEERLSTHETPQGRMRLLKGEQGTILIDDTYNASPYAAKAALAALRDLEVKGKRIAILGDMSELGKHAGEAHADVGTFAAPIVQELVTIGARARGIAEAAQEAGLAAAHVHAFSQGEWDAVVARVRTVIAPGDAILIKGSQSTRLEKVAVQLLGDLTEALKLVRQEDEWKKR